MCSVAVSVLVAEWVEILSFRWSCILDTVSVLVAEWVEIIIYSSAYTSG